LSCAVDDDRTGDCWQRTTSQYNRLLSAPVDIKLNGVSNGRCRIGGDNSFAQAAMAGITSTIIGVAGGVDNQRRDQQRDCVIEINARLGDINPLTGIGYAHAAAF